MTMVLQKMITMPFRRRGSNLGNIVHSVKHVIDVEGVLTGGTTSFVPLTKSVPSLTSPFDPVECELGSTINGMFISLFLLGASGGGLNGSLNWYIVKLRATQSTGAGFPQPGATGTSDVRSQIFHEEKGLAGSADGTPMAFKGVVVIPKGMRRQRDGDQFVIALRNSDATNDANFCIKAIFKTFK